MTNKSNTAVSTEVNDEDTNKALPQSEALSLLKSMQGSTQILAPLIIENTMLHAGIEFNVSLSEYNSFLNESQTGKSSPTACAKNFLMRVVADKDAEFLKEALQVKGVLNNLMMKVTAEVEPNFGESLD